MEQIQKGTVIALGMFDGMHMGHQALISRAVELGRQHDLLSMVYTFYNHPMEVFAKAPVLLSTPEQRRTLMLEMGVDIVEMPVFDEPTAHMPPEDFASLLAEKYRAKWVVAGYNYTFGYKGAGDVALLSRLGAHLGFEVCMMQPVEYQEAPVSSSRIRKAIEQGSMELAHAMLKRPYSLQGRVGEHRHIGRTLGFPTANLLPEAGRALPLPGVYATIAKTTEGRFPAVTNVGNNPTVQGKCTTIETHILDFSADLYGQCLSVEFYHRLRGEKTFASRQELAQQITQDAAAAKALFLRKNQ